MYSRIEANWVYDILHHAESLCMNFSKNENMWQSLAYERNPIKIALFVLANNT